MAPGLSRRLVEWMTRGFPYQDVGRDVWLVMSHVSNRRKVEMVNVSLVKGRESYDAVRRALELIKDDVEIPDKPVLVKPNMVSGSVALAATPVEAMRATLDFLQEQGVKKFIVGEGTAEGDTMAAFQRFGYRALEDEYDVQLVDLNKDETVEATVFDSGLRPARARIAKTVVDSYRVSVARMKTHDTVIVTLAIKNLAVGSIVNADRHAGLSHAFPAMNFSLAKMNTDRPPHLSVIDGVVGMEGRGPVSGTAVSSGVALAGVDATAVDAIGALVMGYDPSRIGYLYYLMDARGLSVDDICVLGEEPQACNTRYKDHPGYQAQLRWQVDDWRRVYASAG